MLDCFEELHEEQIDVRSLTVPEIAMQEHRYIPVPRYSNRKQQKIFLGGIIGNVRLDQISPEVLRLLLAGEILHVGKNTSFGFGRYRVEAGAKCGHILNGADSRTDQARHNR